MLSIFGATMYEGSCLFLCFFQLPSCDAVTICIRIGYLFCGKCDINSDTIRDENLLFCFHRVPSKCEAF